MSAPGPTNRERQGAPREGQPVRTKARAEDEPILAAHGIVNRFGRQRVHDGIDLDVHAGEILGIAGGSGSGKTVLLKTLIGLHRPNRGEVVIAGKRVDALASTERAALFGVLFQQGALFSSLSVAQNVMLPLREHTSLAEGDQERVAAMKLALAGLPPDAGTKSPAQLSGGMVKRAALARALALDPRILFLDEPTSDLDPITASGIDELIVRLNRGLGVTVVIVTHDVTTLFTVCQRIAVLAERRISVGTLDELERSHTAWIDELLRGPRAQGALKTRPRHGIR